MDLHQGIFWKITRRVYSQVEHSTYSANQGTSYFLYATLWEIIPVYVLVCLSFSAAKEHRKYVKNGIHFLSNDYVTVFVTN
jgi:hypothetical protein